MLTQPEMMLWYTASMDLACHYSMSRPQVARREARDAIHMAVALRRPDLAYQANSLLAVI